MAVLVRQRPYPSSRSQGISTVRGIGKRLALPPGAVFPGAGSKPPTVRGTAVAPEQVLQMAPAQELPGRSQDVRGKPPWFRCVRASFISIADACRRGRVGVASPKFSKAPTLT